MENTKQKQRPTQRRRTQAERRDESERELVRAVIELIAEKGVSASTFEAIAARSGYSRGLVGQRFGSKLGLIEAVIAYLHGGGQKVAVGRGLDDLTGLDAITTFADHFLRRLSRMGEVQAYFRLLSSAVADVSEFRSAFAAEHERMREHFEAWVRKGQAEGQIRPDLDPTSAALMIGSQLLGLSIQVLIDPKMDLDPIRATYLATLRLAFTASDS